MTKKQSGECFAVFLGVIVLLIAFSAPFLFTLLEFVPRGELGREPTILPQYLEKRLIAVKYK